MVHAWVIAFCFATGCSFSHGTLPTDASTDSTTDTTADAFVLGMWGNITPQTFGGANASEDDPTLTTDMLEIYFDRSGELYYSVRNAVTDPWPNAIPVPNVNTSYTETTPEITPDGLELYFASDQAGLGTYDIFVATRVSRLDMWRTGTPQPDLSMMSFSDYAPTPASDTVMYGVNTASGTHDIWRSTRVVGGTFGVPQLVPELATAITETEPFANATETTMYFASTPSGTGDLFVAKREAAMWIATPIDELNTMYSEGDAWVSPNQRTIYFSSNRSGTSVIYMATR